jgi:hypothetical protein
MKYSTSINLLTAILKEIMIGIIKRNVEKQFA